MIGHLEIESMDEGHLFEGDGHERIERPSILMYALGGAVIISAMHAVPAAVLGGLIYVVLRAKGWLTRVRLLFAGAVVGLLTGGYYWMAGLRVGNDLLVWGQFLGPLGILVGVAAAGTLASVMWRHDTELR